MLEKITISKVATFNEDEHVLDELGEVNFIFGHNGSGKTTVSRAIKSKKETNKGDYVNCKIEYDESSASEPDILVYNRDFINENIEEAEVKKFPGIFTIGSGDIEIRGKIIDDKKNVETAKTIIASIIQEETKLDSEWQDKKKKFYESCWGVQKQYEKNNPSFIKIFEGFRSDKKKFADELLKIHALLPKEYVGENIETLISQMNKLYADNLLELDPVNKFLDDEINKILKQEKDEILQKKIIGSEDVDIANMINKLNNADWVRQGIPFYKQDEEYCPFCQQIAPDNFADSLADYFNDEYDAGVKGLENYKDDYTKSEKYIIDRLNAIMENRIFEKLDDVEKFQPELEKCKQNIENIFQQNIQKIESKIKEPSVPIFLKSIEEALTNINIIIDGINVKVGENNNLHKNKEDEKKKLEKTVWEKTASEALEKNKDYKIEIGRLEKAIKNTFDRKESENMEIDKLNKIILNNQENLGLSIEPVAEKINKMLENFGLNGFKIESKEIENKGTYYNIIRNNEKPVEESLSEGEKNLLTFLYFYYLCKGSQKQGNVLNDRIIVIDDPVSSLDSNAMFFVSQMIKKLMATVINPKDTEANLKQIFIFTHNIYFHKQVTYRAQGEKGKWRFWIIRKKNDQSYIEAYKEENPIKNSYEVLWSEIYFLKECSRGMQNVLRRILEYYFSQLGDFDFYDLAEKFKTEEDNLTARSLVSWAHAGSHEISDGLDHIEGDSDDFLRIFRQIFIETNHKGHYDMMIDKVLKNQPSDDHPIKILEQQEEGNNTSQNEDAELQS